MKRVTLPLSGREFGIKKLRRRDLADVPEAWPIFYYAVLAIAEARGETETAKPIRDALEKMKAREAYVEAALFSRALEPAIWDKQELRQTAPDGAIPIEDMDEAELAILLKAITEAVGGWDTVSARLEAERIARFCDGGEGSGDAAEVGEANGDEAE